jgi:hypothetical protein
MKKIILIILCLWSVAQAQTVGQFRYDTTKFLKIGGYNEVKIQNSTMGVTNGVFTNVDGNGWGKWVAPAAIVANEWHITGNAGTTAANFLGTTDAQSLRFKINNGLAGLLDINGQNTAFGEGSLSAIGIGTGNTAIGTGNSISLSSGSNNTGVGYTNLNSLETGTLNSVFGYGSMTNSVSGSYNTIIGAQSGVDITTGHHNTFVGDSTGFGPTTGSNNTIIGARVTGLSSSIANNIILSDGAGTIRQQFNSSGALSFNGSSFGSSGQILQSNGSAAIPTWVAAPTGTVTGTGTANNMTKFTGTSAIGNALMTDDGTNVSLIGTSASGVSTPFTVIGGTGTSAGGLKIGAYSATYGGFWSAAVTPSSTNYALIATTGSTDLNSTSNIDFTISDAAAWRINSLKSLLPTATTNTVDLGGTSNLIRSGYFGTSVTSPLYSTTSTGQLSNGTSYVAFNGNNVILGTNSANRTIVNVIGDTYPNGNNTQELGVSGQNWKNIYFGTYIYGGGTASTNWRLSNNSGNAKFELADGSDYANIQGKDYLGYNGGNNKTYIGGAGAIAVTSGGYYAIGSSATNVFSQDVWLNRQSAGVFGIGTNSTNTLGAITLSKIKGGSSTPSIAGGAGAGTSPTVSITGTDLAGEITVTTDTDPSTGNIFCTVTFATAYSTSVYVSLTPTNDAAALLYGSGGVSAALWALGETTRIRVFTNSSAAPNASTEYKFHYTAIQ